MASHQVDAHPVEDVITETEETSKEPQVVAPPPPETVKTVDVEDDEDFEDLTAPPHEEKVENPDEDEEKDIEYSPFVDREDAAPYKYAGESAAFGDFNDDDDDEDDDDRV